MSEMAKVSLVEIERALREYRERFKYLDVFVDDVKELEESSLLQLGGLSILHQTSDRAKLAFKLDDGFLVADIVQKAGVSRFHLAESAPEAKSGVSRSVVAGIVGAAIGAASGKKEGLFGGLLLGLLLGGALAPSTPERVMTLDLDPSTRQWRLYDGAYLSWAKRALRAAA